MTTAYIYFGKPINTDTATAAIQAARSFMGEKDAQGTPLWEDFLLSISSGGGDVISAFAMYNEFNSLHQTVNTHNSGAVDSAAILPFMAGERRTASIYSSFFFHQLQWSFAAQAGVPAGTISDASRWLANYEQMMAEIVAEDSNLSKEDVVNMMREGTIVTPKQAKEFGLIHEIEDYSIPHSARSWQV